MMGAQVNLTPPRHSEPPSMASESHRISYHEKETE